MPIVLKINYSIQLILIYHTLGLYIDITTTTIGLLPNQELVTDSFSLKPSLEQGAQRYAMAILAKRLGNAGQLSPGSNLGATSPNLFLPFFPHTHLQCVNTHWGGRGGRRVKLGSVKQPPRPLPRDNCPAFPSFLASMAINFSKISSVVMRVMGWQTERHTQTSYYFKWGGISKINDVVW